MHRLHNKNKEQKSKTTLEEEIEEIEEIEEKPTQSYLKYYKNVEPFYNFSTNMVKKTIFILLKTTCFFLQASGIYLLWICMHYFSAHLYTKFCVPNTILGFLMSPFMIATPHCQGLRWIVYNAAGIINNMWILIGAWIYSFIFIFNNENNISSKSV